jgi:hypothetical protein
MRRLVILLHRYLGIGLCVLFTMWFVSGIAMIYARDMPRLTQGRRLERMAAIDFSRVHIPASEAAARAGLARPPSGVTLTVVMGRPAFRFGTTTVFADTGELMAPVSAAESVTIASAFLRAPEAQVRHLARLDTADQWTIAVRRQMPLHKIDAGDEAHTVLYISERTGEVLVETTRASRTLAWIAAIPHWLYLAPLRLNDSLWRQVVLWTSGLGSATALLGLILAVWQYRVRYTGLMRWHYWTGAIFGVFALTWVFSGFLSMEPWNWAANDESLTPIASALSGGTMNLAAFPTLDPAAWARALDGQAAKQVDFLRLQDDPYYVVRGAEPAPAPVILAAKTMTRADRFSTESILVRVGRAAAAFPIDDSTLLTRYDAYYYDRDHEEPLPVLRVRLADPARTWLYVDTATSRIRATFSRRERIERWLYHGLHSLDFPFWYDKRPLWDAVVISLCSAGALLSVLGVAIGFRRLRRLAS